MREGLKAVKPLHQWFAAFKKNAYSDIKLLVPSQSYSDQFHKVSMVRDKKVLRGQIMNYCKYCAKKISFLCQSSWLREQISHVSKPNEKRKKYYWTSMPPGTYKVLILYPTYLFIEQMCIYLSNCLIDLLWMPMALY